MAKDYVEITTKFKSALFNRMRSAANKAKTGVSDLIRSAVEERIEGKLAQAEVRMAQKDEALAVCRADLKALQKENERLAKAQKTKADDSKAGTNEGN